MEIENKKIRSTVSRWISRELNQTIISLDYLLSHCNHVYLAELSDQKKIIVKAKGGKSRDSRIRDEIGLIKYFTNTEYNVPKFIAQKGKSLYAMEFVDGRHLHQIKSQEIWKQAGTFIAKFGDVNVSEISDFLLPKTDLLELIQDRLRFHEFLKEPLTTIIKQAEEIRDIDIDVFIHGDMGVNQMTTKNNEFYLLDLESCSVGSILEPLAVLLARIREYSRKWDWRYDELENCIKCLVHGFDEVHKLDRTKLFQLHIREMMSHISDISWKLGSGKQHSVHAHQIAQRIKEEWYQRIQYKN